MMSKMMTQEEWIRMYNDQTRPQFNPVLFERDNYTLIDALKKIILSCQRDLYFTIKVTNFTVIEDYDEILQTLYNYEQEKINKNKNNTGKVDNPYSFINIKDSDIMLLLVDYYIAINDPENLAEDRFQVIIKVPRVVDKYYYRIGGNLFSAVYQIVDGSTYNNTSSNSKKQSITFKTVFMPTRLYRNTYDTSDYNGIDVKYVIYTSRIFNKNIPVVEYFFAKFGLYGGLEFLRLQNIVTITDYYIGAPDTYCFNKEDIFIEVPKFIFDQDLATQCAVMTLYRHINKHSTIRAIKSNDYWLESLALRFNSKPTVEKGLSVLDSLESIYDLETYESIRLPEEDKSDIYRILRWMMREFQELRLKDNSDISTKKVRREDYLSAILGIKQSKGIYRISDSQKKITIEDIKRYIYTDPDFLIDKIVKDKLVGFRNSVNDNDAINALKFSYKGISGLGEQKGSTIPDTYRHIHPSHLGRVDPDASSATDPGLTGLISPLSHVNNKSFAEPDFVEPNEWDNNFNQLMQEYIQMRGQRDLIVFQQSMPDIFEAAEQNESINKKLQILDSCLEQQKTALKAISDADNNTEYNDGEILNDGTVVIYKN